MGSGDGTVSSTLKPPFDPGIEVKKPSLLERISRLSPWRFVLVMSILKILSHFFHILILLLLRAHNPALGKSGHWAALEQRFGLPVLFVYCVVVGPWIETLLGQGLPMAYTYMVSRSKAIYLIAATVWFSYLHTYGYQGSEFWLMMFSHFVGAFLLACVFLHGRKHGLWRAIWMTSMVHSASNLSLLILLLSGRLLG
jgi:hypothetical protein